MKTIQSANLQFALHRAIRTRLEEERAATNNPEFKSALVAGWEAILEALRNGEEVIIVNED